MRVIKLWYHIIAFIQKLFYKLVYRDRLVIGKNVTWRRGFSLMIDKGGKIIIGDDCFFNNDCSIASNGVVTIGSGVLFGESVKIYDHNHRFREQIPIKEQGFSNGEVHIGNHNWIGSNVTVLKNAHIADNCVIGAGCVVSGTIPEGSILKIKENYVVDTVK